MSRLVTSGLELKTTTADINTFPDGALSGAVTVNTVDTHKNAGVQAGGVCGACAGSATAAFREWLWTAGALGTDYHARCYFAKTANPAANTLVMQIMAGATAIAGVRLRTDGAFELFNIIGAAVVGSPSAVLANSTLGGAVTYARVELRVRIGTGAVDQLELRVDGTVVNLTTGLSLTDSIPTILRCGWVAGPGVAGPTLLMDDIAVNDSVTRAGTLDTIHNGFPGDGFVYIYSCTGDVSVGSAWQQPGGSVTNLFTSIDNTPPVGIADTTSAANATNQIRDAVASFPSQYWASYGISPILGTLLGSEDAAGPLIKANEGTTTIAAASDWMAQSIVPTATKTCQGFFGVVTYTGTGVDSIQVDLVNDNAGQPGTTVLATVTLSAADISKVQFGGGGSADIINYFKWTAPVILTSGVTYWIRMQRTTSPGTNVWATYNNNGSSYASGSSATSSNSGGTWTVSSTVDLCVGLFYDFYPVVMVPFLCDAELASATGTKAGKMYIGINNFSGPAVQANVIFNFGDDLGLAGTYPSNWRFHYIAYAAGAMPPRSGAGLLAGVEITSGSTTARPGGVCFMGAYIELQPLAPLTPAASLVAAKPGSAHSRFRRAAQSFDRW